MHENSLDLQLAVRGGVHITTDGPHVVGFVGFFAFTDTTIASATCSLITGAALANIDVPAFTYLPLPGGSTITLSGGSGILIKA